MILHVPARGGPLRRVKDIAQLDRPNAAGVRLGSTTVRRIKLAMDTRTPSHKPNTTLNPTNAE